MRSPADFEVLDTLAARVAPQHTALLVVDMQNDYCAPGGASDQNGRDLTMIQGIVPALRDLVEAARAAGLLIVWAKYTLGPGSAGLAGPEILRRGQNFKGADATVKGTWGHEIIADLPYRPDEDLVVEKRRVSAFIGTDLDTCLRGQGIKTLVVTGVMTQTCVETTVRDAMCYDYYVAVVDDCCASGALAQHETSIRNMATFLRYDEAITTSERLRAIWAAAPTSGRAPAQATPA
ncbi:MAG TPA: isochorismatase family cysteine hydrolase [Chloroflexota bacterium]|nr:isochorismatase family cysteine hydrolase [Chloroflexota bacterium]